MLDDYIEIEESELPKLTDKKMEDYADELTQDFERFRLARQPLDDEIWPACDRAMQCIKDTDVIPTMKLIDNGMLGESDVRVAIKTARDQMLMATLPPDESYLEPVSMDENDDEATLANVKDLVIDKARQADLYESMSVFYEQLMSRGTSAIGCQYRREFSVRKIPKLLQDTLTELAPLIQEAQQADAEGEAPPPVSPRFAEKIRVLKPIFQGPKTFPIDMHRLWLDPHANLGEDNDIGLIHVSFKTMTDLKYTLDPETKEPLYDQKILKDVDETTYSEYYTQYPGGLESTQLMGIDPTVMEDKHKIIPVYMFHQQRRVFDNGDIFLDKFFYAAPSASGLKIIRVHDNPSDYGDKPIHVLACDRWLNTPYGIGLVEKSLSALKAKNIMAAIGLQGHVYNTLPPVAYFSGVFKNDRPQFAPNQWQPIVNRAGIGLDFFKPFPVNPQGLQSNLQEQRVLAEKILSQTGASSAAAFSDPNKSLAKSKTAAQVKQETGDSIIAQQAIVFKVSTKIVQPVAQQIYNYSRQHDTDGATYTVQSENGNARKRLDYEQIDRERVITIAGRKALADKAHLLDNLLKLLEIVSNGQVFATLPTASIILADIVLKCTSKLGLPMKPEYRMDSAQLLASNPEVMQMAIQQALATPEGKQAALEAIMADPQAQQFIAELVQAAKADALDEQRHSEAKEHQERMKQPVNGDHVA